MPLGNQGIVELAGERLVKCFIIYLDMLMDGFN